MAEGYGLAPGLDLRPALGTCARLGYARVPASVTGAFLDVLQEEVDAGPFRPFEESFGPVRQQIDGYDVEIPAPAFPLLTTLCGGIRARVRADGRGIRGTATWTPNEVGIAHYVPGSIGITPHMDGKWFRRLVVVATVYGRAGFAICGSRDPDDVVERWISGPGDLVLMRAPGLAGHRDGRPLHLVHGPMEGERLSLGIRMAGRRD
ncbi:MAG: hypothetical protein K0R20_2064 [Actinomycetia bacterium]|jgi:hypothetical protein|nr:hypothetical protein [Actinomycetes bacterium]